jgi:hypothetical protein
MWGNAADVFPGADARNRRRCEIGCYGMVFMGGERTPTREWAPMYMSDADARRGESNDPIFSILLQVALNEEVKSLPWGTECWIIYKQLQRLFAMQTLDEFAYYHALLLPELQQLTDEQPFRGIRHVFERLGLISRCLRIYIRRAGLNDRMSSLLEAGDAVHKIRKIIDQEVYKSNHISKNGVSLSC